MTHPGKKRVHSGSGMSEHEITFNHGKGLGQYSTIVHVKTAAAL